MTKWCTTDVTVVCVSKETATDIFNTLRKWCDTCVPGYDGENKNRLGKFLILSGLTTHENMGSCGYECDGTFDRVSHPGFEICGYEVSFRTTTAWVPCLRMWVDIFDKCWPDKISDIRYVADEPYDSLHYTNDFEYEDMYYVDTLADNEPGFTLPDNRYTEEELRDELLSFFMIKGIPVNGEDLDSMREQIRSLGVDLRVNLYEYVDVEDLD
jgi:hypothetical protein